MDKKNKKRASSQNRIGMAIIAVIVVILMGAMLASSAAVKRKINAYTAANEQLETEIQEEKDRSEQIAALPDYIDSDEYTEKTAREKFGLVYPDEKIFKAEQ